ncbi:MAG: toxin-antitoxin system YwqK family antitoxin [Vicinamibacterales bacterium]
MRYVPVLLLTLLAMGAGAAADTTPAGSRVHREWWPDGTLRVEAHYAGDVYDGEYRAWYRDGQLYEIRHYADGREEGLQQSWTPDGELYLNYEVRNGRRYGYVNARPCAPLGREGEM